MKRSWLITAAIIIGSTISGIAILADRIGFDHNAHWGMVRVSCLLLGVLIILGTFFYSRVPSSSSRVYFLAALVLLLVIGVDAWFVSVGTWTNWPKSTNYYDMLATSFQHHQLSLQLKVDPVLLSLSNPYDIYARQALPPFTYLFDGSLYKGNYYLYWGPVPALILLPFKYAFPGEIGDQVLVFAFGAGLFIFQSLLLLRIWRRFFEDLPAWTVILGILLAGLINPATWILNQPQIYEASILSGQFFLIGGLYFAFTALDRPSPSIGRLVLTGIFWGSAVGSRNILALPVIFMTLWMLFRSIRNSGPALPWARAAMPFAGLLLPLAAGAGLLGWYNWARFGSVLETGLRYQISGINYNDYYNEIFSIRYILLNLRYYLLTPYKFIHAFPFIKPIPTYSWASTSLSAPIFYYARERVSGLLYTSPFLLFALPAIPLLLSRGNRKRGDENEAPGELRWLAVSLAGIAALSFISLLLYYYCTMRFVEDFIPALTLLAVLGFWRGYRLIPPRWYARLAFGFISVGLAAFTIVVGTLLGISGYTERFRYLNPALFNDMVRFFAR